VEAVAMEELGYVQVVTADGLLVEMDTDGRVVMGPVHVEPPKVRNGNAVPEKPSFSSHT
jgi:hypothetical protein